MTIVIPAISLLLVILIVGAVLALIDGILRVRSRAALLAILEIVLAALLILSLFVQIPLGAFVVALALAVVLIITLVAGPRRGWLTAAALVFVGLWLLLTPDRLDHPRHQRLTRVAAPSGADAIELGDLMAGQCDLRRRHEVEQLLRPAC